MLTSRLQPSGGALHFEGLIQDGAVVVQNISFYKDAALATGLTAEADWNRRGLYIGPQFDHLDVNVQEEFDEFLAARGVDQNLAVFLPEYAEYKEQKVRAAFFSSRSVELGVEADCRFDSGIRRLATERQEVRRGVKSEFFISHSVHHAS